MYHDLLSAPRIVNIPPQGVDAFIEAIATSAHELSLQQGGRFPYSIISEIAANFIHAGFRECTVSILNNGNTLCFADQGPGITKKDYVLLPGVSSASQNMKSFIRGVGSGFPLVKEHLSSLYGYLSIDDNAVSGTVVTLTLSDPPPAQEYPEKAQSTQSPLIEPSSLLTKANADLIRVLNKREEEALVLLNEHGMLGPVDLAELLNISAPTATRLLQKLEQENMVESTQLKKRILSNVGMVYVQEFLALET